MKDYLWCTSKLSFQARFPEIFDQILQNTPVLEFRSRTPPPPHPQKWNSSQSPSLTLPRTHPSENEILARVQIWSYPEHPPPKLKTLIFFPESETDLTQNTSLPPQKIENSDVLSRFQIWPYPEHPPPENWKTLIFFLESETDLTQNTSPSPPKIENSNFLSRFQIWPYPKHPLPENWKL